jgi:predicted kinase
MEVVILIGLPGAGKSTFYRQRLASTHAHVSRDNFVNHRHPARRQAALIEEALVAGRDVVVDNTNLRIVDRAPIIEAARGHGARVVGYFFPPDVPGCRARNRAREGRARVPDVAIYAGMKRLQTPSAEEGFDQLLQVRPAGDMTFRVTPARE